MMVSATAKRAAEMPMMLFDNFDFSHYRQTSIILALLLWTTIKVPKAYGMSDFYL